MDSKRNESKSISFSLEERRNIHVIHVHTFIILCSSEFINIYGHYLLLLCKIRWILHSCLQHNVGGENSKHIGRRVYTWASYTSLSRWSRTTIDSGATKSVERSPRRCSTRASREDRAHYSTNRLRRSGARSARVQARVRAAQGRPLKGSSSRGQAWTGCRAHGERLCHTPFWNMEGFRWSSK